MIVTVLTSWFVASTHRWRRAVGFRAFLASDALRVARGWHAQAWALIALPFALAAMSMRGALKAERPQHGSGDETRSLGTGLAADAHGAHSARRSRNRSRDRP
jgi:hypothetical protein